MLYIGLLITIALLFVGGIVAIELDKYEKKHNKPHRFDVLLMMVCCFSPFVFFVTALSIAK